MEMCEIVILDLRFSHWCLLRVLPSGTSVDFYRTIVTTVSLKIWPCFLFLFLFLKFASCCVNTINIYKFHHQRNSCLLTYVTLHVSTLTGHLQVLQVSHIQLLNRNAYIPICIHMV
jgi:hypothetical protein